MEDIDSLIIKNYEIIKDILYIFSIFLIAWVTYIRAGSNYSMMSRVWCLIIGKKDFNNRQTAKFMQIREDIDKFNFTFNVNAVNMQQIQRLQKRVERQNIDIRYISRARGYFYINTCKVKPPKRKYILAIAILAVVFFQLAALSLQLAITPAAVLKFDDSNTWFSINHNYAKKYTLALPFVDLIIDNWRFDKETCTKENFSEDKLSQITKLTKKEIKVICESFKQKQQDPTITETIKKQKILYFILFMPLLFSLFLFRESIYMLCSYDLRNLLLRKRGKIKIKYSTKYFGS